MNPISTMAIKLPEKKTDTFTANLRPKQESAGEKAEANKQRESRVSKIVDNLLAESDSDTGREVAAK